MLADPRTCETAHTIGSGREPIVYVRPPTGEKMSKTTLVVLVSWLEMKIVYKALFPNHLQTSLTHFYTDPNPSVEILIRPWTLLLGTPHTTTRDTTLEFLTCRMW